MDQIARPDGRWLVPGRRCAAARPSRARPCRRAPRAARGGPDWQETGGSSGHVPRPADPQAGHVGAEVLEFLADVQVLAVLSEAGPQSAGDLGQLVDQGYGDLVPAALARLAAQGTVEPAAVSGSGPGRWQLAC
jgi:hypothetical protein